MWKLLALVALLGEAGVGRADDEAAVKRLKAVLGQNVSYDDKHVLVKSASRETLELALRHLGDVRRSVKVHLYGTASTALTDAQLERVCALPRLQSLVLSGGPADAPRLRIVADARGLRELFLFGTDLTDEGLAELACLPRLETLNLANVAVTDTGLDRLKGCKGLTVLKLVNCREVTNAGLRRLEGLDHLRVVTVWKCPGVTDAGAAGMRKALPGCVILVEP